jgi:hypothetical protein
MIRNFTKPLLSARLSHALVIGSSPFEAKLSKWTPASIQYKDFR